MCHKEFVEMIEEQLGQSRASSLIEALETEPTTSIRLNPSKLQNNSKLTNLNFQTENKPLSEDGFFLQQRGNFTHDPLFHSGCYYVQEASSMALETIIPAVREYLGDEGVVALDLCAAPGGKSTHLLSMLRNFPESFLVSNEVIGSRASILAENIEKWGAANVVVTNNDPKDFAKLEAVFNLMVVDAPCSGEGMFRKDHKARGEWSPDAVQLCASRQRRIVADVWGALAEGGLMVYSTCTFNRYENGDNVEWIASELGAEVLNQRQFYPGEEGAGEGFFMALLKKDGSLRKNYFVPSNFKSKLTPYKCSTTWLQGEFSYFLKGDILKAYPKALAQSMLYIESKLKAIRGGVAVASVKSGKSKDLLVPEHSLALNQSLEPNAFETVNLDLPTALKYLARESVVLRDAPLGYILLCYENTPIGFVKNLGNRTNSLFPAALRIRNYSVSSIKIALSSL